jgi:hypothetical protein
MRQLRQRQDKFEAMLSQVLNGEQDESVTPEKAAGAELHSFRLRLVVVRKLFGVNRQVCSLCAVVK